MDKKAQKISVHFKYCSDLLASGAICKFYIPLRM